MSQQWVVGLDTDEMCFRNNLNSGKNCIENWLGFENRLLFRSVLMIHVTKVTETWGKVLVSVTQPWTTETVLQVAVDAGGFYYLSNIPHILETRMWINITYKNTCVLETFCKKRRKKYALIFVIRDVSLALLSFFTCGNKSKKNVPPKFIVYN